MTHSPVPSHVPHGRGPANSSDNLASDPDTIARELGRAFREHGFELFLVGGAVRDRLLGHAGTDLDFATSARPDVTYSILAGANLGRPFRVGEKFGTIGLVHGQGNIEVTTYRSVEVYAHGSRKPEVEFGSTLTEDLQRRDFTVNAMAMDPISLQVLDPLGGRGDLDRGVIRAVGDPVERFREDPLRLLRCVRFATRLGFSIHPPTWEAVGRTAPSLAQISRERIRDEYTRLLTGPRPDEGMVLLNDSGLIQASVPQLLELTRMPDHGPRHPLSLWDHTMNVLRCTPAIIEVRWAALLHDIAKPATRTHEPDGRPRFFHHESVGANIARDVLTSLRYPKALVDDVALLIESHMQLHAYSDEWSDGAVRRLMLRLGETRLAMALALVRADAAGHDPTGASYNAPKFDRLQARIDAIGTQTVQTMRSPLTGHDLMTRFDRPPGPWIKRIKDVLDYEVIEGRLPVGDTDAAWIIAEQILAGTHDE